LTSNITLSDNRVVDAGQYGIFIRNASDILISNNEIDDSGVEGVRVQFSANVTVTGNLVARAGEPVVVRSVDGDPRRGQHHPAQRS
jgi:parallel beta-helix repeat protein